MVCRMWPEDVPPQRMVGIREEYIVKGTLACIALVLALTEISAWAQLRSPRSSRLSRGGPEPAVEAVSGQAVQIRNLGGLGRSSLVRTPEYKTSHPPSSARAGEWAEIVVEYDTAPEWLDEATFSYYVMALSKEGGEKAYSLYRLTVRYVDIERGRSHRSAVYLHPNTIKRYGDVVAVAVEISTGGTLMDVDSDVDKGVKLPEKWWQDPNVLNSDSVTVREGYLMNRWQTPFAYVNFDDFEVTR